MLLPVASKAEPGDCGVPEVVEPDVAERAAAAVDLGAGGDAGAEVASGGVGELVLVEGDDDFDGRPGGGCVVRIDAGRQADLFDVTSVGGVGRAEAEADGGRLSSLGGLCFKYVADAVVGDGELELPVGREVGDRDKCFAALDGAGGEAAGEVPSQHAAGDRAADAEAGALGIEQSQFALEVVG